MFFFFFSTKNIDFFVSANKNVNTISQSIQKEMQIKKASAVPSNNRNEALKSIY